MKKELLLYAVIAGISLSFTACQKETRTADFTVLSTNPVSISGTTVNGVEFSAEIVLNNGTEILEQGFVYGMQKGPNFNRDLVVRVAELQSGQFKAEPRSALIPDTTYYLKAYIKTSQELIYGNEVSFYSSGSMPPFIDKIEPAIAFWGDTIMITGQNFDHGGKNNKVSFNNFHSQKTWGSGDTIYTIVPNELNAKTSELTVELYGKSSDNSKSFDIYSPVINSVSQTKGQYPDTVIIEGDYFSDQYLSLNFGEIVLEAEISQNKIQFQVPFLGDEQDVEIKVNQFEETLSRQFRYHEQKITGLSRDSMYLRDKIVVYGNNMDFRRADFRLMIEGGPFIETNAWEDSVQLWYTGSLMIGSKMQFEIIGEITDYITREIYSTTIFHKDMYIMDPERTEVEYMGNLSFDIEGLSFGMRYFNIYDQDNQLVVTKEAYTVDYETFNIRLPEEVLPGKYSIEIQENSRVSNRIKFEVKRPVINTFGNKLSYKRGQTIGLTGEFLPNTPIAYQLRHESGRVIKRGTYAYEYGFVPENYSTRQIIGKGEYNLEIVFNDEIIQTGHSFILHDYFDFVSKCEDFKPYEEKGKVCFAKDGKLFYLKPYENILQIVDINKSEVSNVTTNISLNDGITFPIIVNQKVYIKHDYKLYEFDFISNLWEKITINEENDSVVHVANFNNELVITNTDNDLMKLNGVWQKIGNAQLDYYSFGLGDYYYTGFHNGFSKVSITNPEDSTFIKSPLGRWDWYFTYRHYFVHDNHLYGALYYQYELQFARLSTRDDSFAMLDPDYITNYSYSSKFFSDVNGDVFCFVKGNVYKFNP